MKSTKKRVLIITYYWPPNGGGGVQRWLKFAKYLPEFGWEPIVYTPENPEFVQFDESLNKDISTDITVLKNKIWEPYDAFRKLTGKNKKGFKQDQGIVFKDGKAGWKEKLAIWVRSNLMIPDPRKYWVTLSIKYLSQYLKDHPVDLIITTSPPHSLQLIGLGLKKRFNIPWIADFRDPWSNWDILREQFNLSKSSLSKHIRLEKQVLQNADLTLTVSKTWEEEFKELGALHTAAITNGYDQEDFENISFEKSNKFVIGHFGLINQYRNPKALWAALDQLIEENASFKSDFELNLTGVISSTVKEDIVRHKNLAKKTIFNPPVPHKEVLVAYKSCHLLLLLSNNSLNNNGHLPGKLFEYIGSKTPILGYTNKQSDCNQILRDLNHYTFQQESIIELKRLILSIYKPTNNENQDISIGSTFERKNLTQTLANTMNNLISL